MDVSFRRFVFQVHLRISRISYGVPIGPAAFGRGEIGIWLQKRKRLQSRMRTVQLIGVMFLQLWERNLDRLLRLGGSWEGDKVQTPSEDSWVVTQGVVNRDAFIAYCVKIFIPLIPDYYVYDHVETVLSPALWHSRGEVATVLVKERFRHDRLRIVDDPDRTDAGAEDFCVSRTTYVHRSGPRSDSTRSIWQSLPLQGGGDCLSSSSALCSKVSESVRGTVCPCQLWTQSNSGRFF